MGVRVRMKNGKYYCFINHKRQRKAVCVGTSKQMAEHVKQRLEAELAVGNRGVLTRQPAMPTFAAYAQQWLDGYVTLRCKPSSQRILRGFVRLHLAPAFGPQRLDAITRGQVKAFLIAKAQQYSRSYALRVVKTLGTILAHAVEEEILGKNPATRVGKLLPDGGRGARAIHPFTSQEVAQYLAAMHEHYPQHYAYFLTLARTGMREGEALGLQWDDVTHRAMHIQRTWDAAHQCYNTPKSGKTRRIEMSQQLREVVLALHNERQDAAYFEGHTDIAPVVFCGPSGHPYAPATLHAVHKRVCQYAGLRVNRIHDLRHSVATILLYECGEKIQDVSTLLGHSSIKMTVDVYGHPPGGNSRLVDQLDRGSDGTEKTRESVEGIAE